MSRPRSLGGKEDCPGATQDTEGPKIGAGVRERELRRRLNWGGTPIPSPLARRPMECCKLPQWGWGGTSIAAEVYTTFGVKEWWSNGRRKWIRERCIEICMKMWIDGSRSHAGSWFQRWRETMSCQSENWCGLILRPLLPLTRLLCILELRLRSAIQTITQ